MGPLGPLTIDDLPSSATTYWVSRRKAEVLAAIDGKKPLVYAPFMWGWIMAVIRMLPRFVMRKVGF